MFVLVAIGVLLPTMHQSSLGRSMMIISGTKLSPLWQSGLLPFYNVLTAILMGYGIVLFESYLSALAFKRPFETPLLSKVAGVIPGLLLVYLVVRWADLLFSGALGSAFSGVAGLMFWVENLLFVAALAHAGAGREAREREEPLQLGLRAAARVRGAEVQHVHRRLQPGSGVALLPLGPRDHDHARDRRGRDHGLPDLRQETARAPRA